MSYGLGVGEFIAIIRLANQIRKEFVSAPQQYDGLAADVKSLSIILQDIEVFVECNHLSQTQEENIFKIGRGCKKVLEGINKALNKYSSLSVNETGSTRSSLGKRARKVWQQLKLEPQEFRDYRNAITTNVSMLNTFMTGITRDGMIKLIEAHDDHGKQATLEWLSTADYQAQQAETIRQRLKDTGRWLLESLEYKEWLGLNGEILFLNGIPGTGKTVLSSVVIEQLQDRCREDINFGLIYLYCEYNRQEALQLDKILSSWLRQLSETLVTTPPQVKQLYDDHKGRRTRPSLEEIREVVHAIARSFTGFYVVVDALDECQGTKGHQRYIIEELKSLNETVGANILVTSRPVLAIQAAFHCHPSIEVRASDDDIRRFVDANIAYLPTFVADSPELQEEIKANVVKAAEGMFLLAKLNFESLKGKTRKKQLRAAMVSLVQRKGGYDEAYRKTMDLIETKHKDERDLAIEVLAWVVHSVRPLKVEELLHALAVEVDEGAIDEDNIPDMQMIMSVCCGLISRQAETNVVQLIHHTAKEFLMEEGSKYLEEAKIKLSTACVAYLLLKNFGTGICRTWEDLEHRFEIYSFYEYASRYWGSHAKSACDRSVVCRLLDEEQNAAASIQALLSVPPALFDENLSEGESTLWTALHFVAYLGLDDLLQHALSRCDMDAVDFRQWTALSRAAERGHEIILRELIVNGAQLDTVDCVGQTALSLASKQGHGAVVRALLEHGAQPDIPDANGQTALIHALEYGHEPVIRSLLKNGAQLPEKILSKASGRDSESVIRLLLENGARPDEWNLVRASMTGHEAVVRLLLQHGAQPDGKAFAEASGSGHEAVVRLLLDHGTHIDAADEDGQTALIRASRFGHAAIARLLLERYAQIDLTDRRGGTALIYACKSGNETITRLLLAAGANIDIADKEGQTALSHASRNGHEVTARLLVEKGAKIDIADMHGRTAPEHVSEDDCSSDTYASSTNHEAVANRLLAASANISVTDVHGPMAL